MLGEHSNMTLSWDKAWLNISLGCILNPGSVSSPLLNCIPKSKLSYGNVQHCFIYISKLRGLQWEMGAADLRSDRACRLRIKRAADRCPDAQKVMKKKLQRCESHVVNRFQNIQHDLIGVFVSSVSDWRLSLRTNTRASFFRIILVCKSANECNLRQDRTFNRLSRNDLEGKRTVGRWGDKMAALEAPTQAGLE